MNFISGLGRRNVLRAAVLYAGAVWPLAQVITRPGPVFHAPSWIAQGASPSSATTPLHRNTWR